MTTVVYSHVTDPRQGGGLPCVLAIAAALAEEDEVSVRFPAPLRTDLAKRLFPVPLDGMRLEHDPRRSTLAREISDVLAGFALRRVVVQATEVPRLRGLRNAHLVCEFPFCAGTRPCAPACARRPASAPRTSPFRPSPRRPGSCSREWP